MRHHVDRCLGVEPGAAAEGTVANVDDTFSRGGIGVGYVVAVVDVHGSAPVGQFSRIAWAKVCGAAPPTLRPRVSTLA